MDVASRRIQCLDCGAQGFEPIMHYDTCKPNTREKEVTQNFTLLEVAFVDVDGRQYAINAAHLETYISPALQRRAIIESIPWGEMINRSINSVCLDNGKIVLGLSTKEK